MFALFSLLITKLINFCWRCIIALNIATRWRIVLIFRFSSLFFSKGAELQSWNVDSDFSQSHAGCFKNKVFLWNAPLGNIFHIFVVCLPNRVFEGVIVTLFIFNFSARFSLLQDYLCLSKRNNQTFMSISHSRQHCSSVK